MQCFAEPIHGLVQAVIEVHKFIGWPESLFQLFARDEFTRPLKQRQ
jgi:hypothetical protein